MTSTKRIEANRKNARMSTGPRTEAGKSRSRLNALKHGLRAEEVVLPTEGAGEFDQFLGAWMDDWKPPTEARRHLVERAAVAAWRLRRCVRVESARLAARVRDAMDAWDDDREAEVEEAVDMLVTDPPGALERLKETRLGVARLIGLWEDIADASSRPEGWDDPAGHHVLFLRLQGYMPLDAECEESEEVETMSWRLILANNPECAADPSETRDPLTPEVAAKAARLFHELAGARIGQLRAYQSRLPDDSAERARHAEVAAFEPRDEDAALLRYEGRLDREVRATIAQLASLNRSDADIVAIDEPDEAVAEAPAVAAAPNEPKVAASGPAPEPSAPNEPNGVGGMARVVPVAAVYEGPSGTILGGLPAPAWPLTA